MKLAIVCRRRRGVRLSDREILSATPIVGDVHVYHGKSDALGRFCNVAGLRKDHQAAPVLLPDLMDVSLGWMRADGLVLFGIEKSGDQLFEQSWWCKTTWSTACATADHGQGSSLPDRSTRS